MADKEVLIKITVDNAAAKKSIEEQTLEITKLNDANDKLKKKNKELANSEKDTTKERAKNSVEIAKNTAKIQAATKIRKDSINSIKSSNNSYGAMKLRLREVAVAIDKVDLSTKKGQQSIRALRQEQNKLNTSLKAGEASGASFGRNVGNYKNVLNSAASSMTSFNLTLLASPIGLIVAALGSLVLVGKQAFGFFKEYEVIMSKVKATTQATKEEIDLLRDSTIEFGESTKFTATEVGQLQLELAKLGFTTSEIIDATGAILDLAVATDSELGRAAEVVAKTLNQFSLEASESTRVADVMARSFTTTALDIEIFAEGMKNAGVASKLVGVDIEQTTAILGVLADNGVDASTAGTQLKNVFIELADQGITWEDAMSSINKSQNRLTTSNDLFGKRAAIVSAVIAENGDRIDDLSQSYREASGAASDMAEIVGNNLQGDIDRLSSSWEGLIARGSLLNTFFRIIVVGIKQFVDDIKGLPIEFERMGLATQYLFRGMVLSVTQSVIDVSNIVGITVKGAAETVKKLKDSQEKDNARIAEINQELLDKTNQHQKEYDNIFKEGEDAKTAAKLKGIREREKITNLENTKQLEKENDDIEKSIAKQKDATFKLEDFRRERDAEEEQNRAKKLEKLIELENERKYFLLENENLIETEKELIIEESEQRVLDLKKRFLDEDAANKTKAAEEEKKLKEKADKESEKSIEADKKLRIESARSYLTILSSVLQTAGNLAGENFALQKAFSIGQAIINTAQGVTQAFAQGGPLGFATGGAVAAAGAVQIAKIASTTPDTGGGGGVAPVSGTAPTPTQPQINTSAADTAQAENEALEAAISRIGLSVSVSEINEAQVQVSEAESGSSI